MAQALEEGSGGGGGGGGLGLEEFDGLLLRDEAQLDLYDMRAAAVHEEAGASKQARLNGQQGSPAHGARSGCVGCCTS